MVAFLGRKLRILFVWHTQLSPKLFYFLIPIFAFRTIVLETIYFQVSGSASLSSGLQTGTRVSTPEFELAYIDSSSLLQEREREPLG